MFVAHIGAAALIFALCAVPGLGCAVAPSFGMTVEIAEESAVIVWDAATKTEHFIRRATFNTKAPDFGFLVPTPTQPTLAAVQDGVFKTLEEWTKPRVVEEDGGVQFVSFCLPLGGSRAKFMADKAPTAGVTVLHSERVAGYDAVVLDANGAEELGKWLKDHGYATTPELTSWLAPYVAARWKITAFKIAQDAQKSGSIQTDAVRMSFQTDQPFYPYREPESAAPKTPRDRLLRVFFLTTERVDGKLGTGPWPVHVPWSDRIDDNQRATLTKTLGIPDSHFGEEVWLTTFEDHASPRPTGLEVYFEPAKDPTPTRPPDIVQRLPPLVIPLELVLLPILAIGGIAALVWAKHRRRPA